MVTRPMQGLERGQRTRGGSWSHGDAPAGSFRGVGAVWPRGRGGARTLHGGASGRGGCSAEVAVAGWEGIQGAATVLIKGIPSPLACATGVDAAGIVVVIRAHDLRIAQTARRDPEQGKTSRRSGMGVAGQWVMWSWGGPRGSGVAERATRSRGPLAAGS